MSSFDDLVASCERAGLAHAFFRAQGIAFNSMGKSSLGKGAWESPVFGLPMSWSGKASAPGGYCESAWALLPLNSPALRSAMDAMREIHQGARANNWKAVCALHGTLDEAPADVMDLGKPALRGLGIGFCAHLFYPPIPIQFGLDTGEVALMREAWARASAGALMLSHPKVEPVSERMKALTNLSQNEEAMMLMEAPLLCELEARQIAIASAIAKPARASRNALSL